MSETVSSETTSDSTAETASDSGTSTEQPDGQATASADTGLSTDERAELEKLRAVHKDERRWERRAKENFSDAEKLRTLAKALGGDSKSEDFDPKTELASLRQEIATANTERVRADVARVKGVDPSYLVGATQEEMESAADRYLADVEARVNAALQQAQKITSPATESTSIVKSGDRVEGPKQITSEAELKKLSGSQQLAAYKDGRLDKMLGR